MNAEKNNSVMDFLAELFPPEFLQDGTISKDSFQSPIDNAYINSRQSDSQFSQSIASDFVVYIIDYHVQNSYHYILSLESSAAIYMPPAISHLSHLHKHDYLELVYILEGELDFIIEGGHKRYHAGDCCIINQNVRHAEEYISAFSAIYFSLRTDFIASMHFSEHERQSSQLFQFLARNTIHNSQVDYLDFYPIERKRQNQTQEITKLINLLLLELNHRYPGYRDILMGYIKRLFFYLQSPTLYICSNTRFYQKSGSDLFEKTMAYINSHRYKITRAELSDALHYNGNHIGEVFMKNTGITLAEYIREVCLKEAASLLLNTDLTTTEIINKVGFQNRTAFYRQFESYYGMTPKKYRHHNI